MFASTRIQTILTLAFALLCSLTAAHAQEKVWKHGILEAKSDAGFIAMVDRGSFAAKRGLKVELLQSKGRRDSDESADFGRDRQSVDMGAAEVDRRRHSRHGSETVGCTWPGVPQVVLAKAEIRTLADLKGENSRHFFARVAARPAVSRHAGRCERSLRRCEAGYPGGRSRSLQIAACRNHRRCRGIE